MMIIEIYGKQSCEKCDQARKKVAHFLNKWSLEEEVEVVFVDTDTEEGAAEADFFDVFEIPTVLLKKNQDDVVARWEGKAPPSAELSGRLSARK